jgi:hypothetical protein
MVRGERLELGLRIYMVQVRDRVMTRIDPVGSEVTTGWSPIR